MARIAVGGFQHETNSFVTPPTDFAYFTTHRDRPPLVRGTDVLTWLGDPSFALSGFLKAINPGQDIVPLLWTSGGAGGPVTADAYERIAGEMIGRLSEVSEAAACATVAAFHSRHERLYTFAQEDTPVEIVTIRVDVEGVFPLPKLPELAPDGSATEAIATQALHLGSGTVQCPRLRPRAPRGPRPNRRSRHHCPARRDDAPPVRPGGRGGPVRQHPYPRKRHGKLR